MRMMVINPNTTMSMTDSIGRAARAAVGPDVRVEAVSPGMGPVSIEGHYDEVLASVGVVDEVRRGEACGVDAFVIACFGDPGLQAARELASGPVVGVAEAAFRAAGFAGRSFAIVTTLGRTLGRARDLVAEYGCERQCVAYRACEVPVLGLEDDEGDAYMALEAECDDVLRSTDADAIVLGCAGMGKLCGRLADHLAVPVIDGVAAGAAFAEGLVRIGMHTGKRREFARPIAKPVRGLLSGFSLEELPGGRRRN